MAEDCVEKTMDKIWIELKNKKKRNYGRMKNGVIVYFYSFSVAKQNDTLQISFISKF